jgi:hypothetical protein
MRLRIGHLCFTMLLAGTSAAWAGATQYINPPSGALLVGKSNVSELRAFPEMAATAEGRANAAAHPVVAAQASDAVYQSPQSYNETVRFFDEQLANKKLRVVARTVTETSTAWTVDRGDSTRANIIVRTTTPHVTVEIAQVDDASR